MSDFVDIKNVTKEYHNILALNDVSLQLDKGKIYGLIGSNGSGKTTLIKAITGLIEYSGEIIWYGINKNKLSYVPEIINFYEYLTGIQALKLITKIQDNDIHKMLNNFERNALLIDYYDCNKLIKQHSKGNLRKLMLLQAFSVDSEILILDEPFSGLDPIAVEKIKILFTDKKLQGKIILLSTHLFDVAKAICDELIFIKNGVILAIVKNENFSEINLENLFNDEI